MKPEIKGPTMTTQSPENIAARPLEALQKDAMDPEEMPDSELAFWWDFCCEEESKQRDIARWEEAATPTALDVVAREDGLKAARAALAEHRKRSEVWQRDNIAGTATSDNATTTLHPRVSADDELAALFDPVTAAQLETMFPANGQWKRWAERASNNGLKAARVGRARFNPYKAAQWFLHRGLPGWDQARLFRVLGKNLPPRAQRMRAFFDL